MTTPITLSSYLRKSWSAPIEEQILLVNNPYFFNRFAHCLFKPNLPIRILRRCLRNLHVRLPTPIKIPASGGIFLLAYEHSSFDSLNGLPRIYDQMARRPRCRYKLVIGKGDYCFDKTYLNGIPENLDYIIANNVAVEDQRVGYLPMGRDFRAASVFREASPTEYKEILCYCNFSVTTHPVRKQVYESVRAKKWIIAEHMGAFQQYSISRSKFLQRLAQSKFVICPRGNGLDTFRMWDCLYLGAIPIVVKEAAFHKRLNDLPILFLDSYSEYGQLSREYLESTYRRMLNCEYDYSKLLLSTWLNQFAQYMSRRSLPA